jgi:hypothetical protein
MEDARRCVFAIENDNSTPGYRGLAWAVMLMAVHDGCCARWLREIACGYALELPETIFDGIPANRIKQKKGDHELMAVEMPSSDGRLVLEWDDALSSTTEGAVGA